MNVTIIYGSTYESITYNFVQILLNKLRLNINVNATEFFLPPNSSYMNFLHCNTYIKKYHNNINSIITSLVDSDLIIFACPVIACNISTEMKIFLNHLSSCVKNKTYLMNNKIGLAISTTAGAGLFYTTKTLKRHLNFLGIKNVFRFSKTIYELNWEDVNVKNRKQIDKKFIKLSYKILNLYKNSCKIKLPNFDESKSSEINPVFENSYCIINLSDWKKHRHCPVRHIFDYYLNAVLKIILKFV